MVFVLNGSALFSQNFSTKGGVPFIRNYTPEEYNAHEQNFDIVQGANGIMYFANFSGILEFDGTKWRTIPTSSGLRVIALDIDKDGIVYAGGLSDFGYIKHLGNGNSEFVSLSNSLAEDPGMIFQVICGENSVYFFSSKSMYVYSNQKITTVKFDGKALSAFSMQKKKDGDALLIFFERNFKSNQSDQNGPTLYNAGKFVSVNDKTSSQIIDAKSMFVDTDNLFSVLGTSGQGMFILKDHELVDFDIPVNSTIKQIGHTCGVKINETDFALGTYSGGIVICDKNGNILKIIDKNSLLQNETVNALFVDKENALWAATDDGISKIEVNRSLTYIDFNTSGLEGKIQDIDTYGHTLYFATDKGLYYIENSYIRKVQGINFACRDIEIIGDKLMAATTKGLFLIENNVAKATELNNFAFCIARSSNDNSIFYVGFNGKISILKSSGKGITLIDNIDTGEGDVYKLYDDTKGVIYAEIAPGRIFKYTGSEKKGSELKPDDKIIALHLNRIGDSVFFSSEKGIYRFNNQVNRIEPFDLFSGDTSTRHLWIYDVYKIDNNRFVVTDGEQKNISFYNRKEKKFIKNQTPLLPVSHFQVNAIYYSPESGLLWVGGKNGLVIYKQGVIENYEGSYKTLIRSVKVIDQDSLLNLSSEKRIKLNNNQNSLRFEFSAPVYITKGVVFYRYFLQGFDKDSSEWSELTYKDYTNIPNGKYVFTVQAMNQYGKTLEKTEFSFEILKPVYRRWWAFIIYVAVLYFMIRFYMNWRIRSVEKERKVLEDTVKERTEEIAQSKEEIETQRDELYKQKQEIVDSINYAQRIQTAVLPSDELMQEVLGEHFVFYKPRDIVSGDFYWVKKIKNFSYAVVADCTGHGVPGAFMSMLGNSFLNEIVTSRTLDTAAETLNKLRNKVKKSLHQRGEEGEQKDGMDISLMIIDWDTNEMQFAGAYNSAYLIRKKTEKHTDEEEYELIKLEADRQPIGIYLNEKEFTNHTVKLQKGDAIYALSDGYVDQFGGDTGGKFKSVRFQQLLLSFQDKSPEEQKVILGRTFNKWKRDLFQVDDVLVMGIIIS